MCGQRTTLRGCFSPSLYLLAFHGKSCLVWNHLTGPNLTFFFRRGRFETEFLCVALEPVLELTL